MIKKKEIGYNSQINNITADGIKGSSQCFATSAWMFLSFYSDKFKAEDDAGLKTYMTGITEHGAEKEFEWEMHQKEIQKYLDDAGIKGAVRLGIDLQTGAGTITPVQLKLLLLVGPVIIGTKRMAGLPGGHIILAIDSVKSGDIICHDPYGNALTNYTDKNGERVSYQVKLFDAKYPQGPIRAMWLEG